MCFSPTASFVSAGVLASIGAATWRHVREPRTLLFASVPMLFAIHQFCEGMVWLGFEGRIGTLARDHFAFLFTLYAQGILPLLMPAAVALMEPRGWRRSVIFGLTAIGAIVCAWDAYGLIFVPSRVFVDHFSIAYRNTLTGNLEISLLYILATCGSLLLSSHRVVRTYGLVNVVALTIVQLVRAYAFASVWCFYAAIMSVIIYWQFRRGTLAAAAPENRVAATA
jgi:hypothetical protein